MAEDFTNAINAVGNDDLSSDDEDVGVANAGSASHVDEPDGGLVSNVMRELEEMQRILVIPAPDATVADLRKALGEAQLAYTRVRKELDLMRTKYNQLQSQLSSRTRARTLKLAASGGMDNAVASLAKMYALAYHLWVPQGIFPLRAFPADFNFSNPRRYDSTETRATAYAAELYLLLPVALQTQAIKYEQFQTQFTNHVNAERPNLLKPLKDSAVTLFAHLSPALNPVALAGESTRRAGNPDFLSLLKRDPQNPEEQYTPLAPILFDDTTKMDVQGLFKNQVLTKMASVCFFGKGILNGKKRGGPPGRGKKMGLTTVTAGMIAACCTIARYLLSGDEELSATGGQTGITYERDFEFYLEMLQKPSNKEWSLGVINHFNKAVFGTNQKTPQAQDQAVDTEVDGVRSWEDDILAQLGGFNGAQDLEPAVPAPAVVIDPVPAVVAGPTLAATQLSFHPVAQLAAEPAPVNAVHPTLNINFPYQTVTAANPPLIVSAPAYPTSISGNVGAGAHAAVPAAFAPPQNHFPVAPALMQVSPTQSVTVSAASEVHLPLVIQNLSLGPGPRTSGSASAPLNAAAIAPIVVPVLVNSAKAPKAKRKKTTGANLAEGEANIAAPAKPRALRSKSKRAEA